MDKRLTKVALGSIAGLIFGCSVAYAQGPTAKNLILFVVDGLTVGDLAAAKPNLKSLLNGGNMMMVTPSSTDPASAVTAMATGKTTDAGRISISPEGNLTGYDSIVTRVIPEQGTRAAGLITTGDVTDSTVAAFYSHSKDVAATDFIASQASVSGYDVILGGGKGAFTTKAQGGIREVDDDIWTGLSETYKVVANGAELAAIADQKAKILGLFSKSGQPGLASMTEKAISQLSDTPSGFALIVNEARLDQVKNAQVDATAWNALDDAIGVAVKFADSNPDTLVVVASTVGTDDRLTQGFFSKVEYGYTSVPVPVIAGGSSSAAGQFKGYTPNTSVFTLIATALGASTK